MQEDNKKQYLLMSLAWVFIIFFLVLISNVDAQEFVPNDSEIIEEIIEEVPSISVEENATSTETSITNATTTVEMIEEEIDVQINNFYYETESMLATTEELQTDLIAYYKFDENSNDSLDTYNATSTNVTYGSGKVGNGVLMNGNTSKIATDLNISGDFSISTWFYGNTGTFAEYPYIYGDWETGGLNIYLIFYAGGDLLFLRGDGGTEQSGNLWKTGLSEETWYHIVVTQEGNTRKIYIDGVEVSTESSAYTGGITGNPTYIGSNVATTEDYYTVDGIIDEMGFWSRALTSDEITTLYNEGNGFTYPFEEETATSTATTTTSTINTGNLEFGLAIIIALLSLNFVSFIWNRTGNKKSWK